MNQNAMHPMFFVDDLSASIGWFEKLGFQVGMRLDCPQSGKPVHISLSRNEIMVMAGQKMPGMDVGQPSGALSLYFVGPEDIKTHDALCAQWKKDGVEITQEPKDQYWGHRTFEVRHPEGFALTFAVVKEELSPDQMSENLKTMLAAMA